MSKTGRVVGAVIVLVGAILLLAALFTPWYTIQVKDGGVTLTQNAYLGLPSTNGTIQYTCSGLPSGASCTPQTSYSKADANNTGNLAEGGYFLIIVGFIFGLLGAIVGFTSRAKARRARSAMTLAIVALVLTVAAVGAFAVALPTAYGQDSPGHPSGNGPWSSFFGSGNASSFGLPGGTLTWGPGIGWYLAIGAFALLIVGLIVLALARKEPPSPVPVSTPAPAGAAVGSTP